MAKAKKQASRGKSIKHSLQSPGSACQKRHKLRQCGRGKSAACH
jgi:hypothetical protein